jgi:two-component system, cell cycle sensor histidine kinase and response regulator CckA
LNKTTPRASADSPELLLLVEDNEEAREALRRALEWHGYEVITAENASDAERRFGRTPRPVDLLVADVILPDRTGVELARALAPRHPGLRVLFLSGYSDMEIDLEVHGVGVSSFLEKPVTIRRLGEEVRKLLDARVTVTSTGP